MQLAVWAHPITTYLNDTGEMGNDFKKMSKAGIDIYYPFVCLYGNSCYPSKFATQVTKEDLLKKITQIASYYNIEVHPVVAFISLGADHAKSYIGHGAQGENPVGHAICPSQEANRKFVLDIVSELIENYKIKNNHPIKGIHLDYMRYPNAFYSLKYPCECSACREYRKNWWGEEIFTNEDMINPGKLYKELEMRSLFVKGLVTKIRKLTASAEIELSMAAREVYSFFALAEGQDWVEWSKEGLVDVISPMSYTTDFNHFEDFVSEHSRLLKNGKATYFAGVGRKSSKGELTPDEMIRQIQYAFAKDVQGCTIFHFGALTDEDFEKITELKFGK
jgi:uncharacterized lipoprotein YddW (UPF0748 family)